VDEFLPPFRPGLHLETGTKRSFGAPVNQQAWNQTRRDMAAAMAKVGDVTRKAGQDWGRMFGRDYDLIETYRTQGAEVVFITMGSLCGTAREAVDHLRGAGQAVGLVKLRLFRPLPEAALRQALAGVSCGLVLDRNYAPGMGGVLHQETKAALYGQPDMPRLYGLLTGVGGVNVSTETLEGLVAKYRDAAPMADPIWVE